MDPVLEIRLKRFHDSAVLRNAAEPVKMTGRDSDTKMGFTTLPPSGVTEVLTRFVDHIEENGGKSCGELGSQCVFDAHGILAFKCGVGP